MTPELFEKWEHIIDDVDKTKIPLQFIKKIVVKMNGSAGRKQHTINIQSLIKQGFDDNDVEQAVRRKLEEFDDEMTSIEFMLDIEGIAATVQPETDNLLKNL